MLRAGPAAVAGVVAVGLAVHHHLEVGAERMGEDVGGIPRPGGHTLISGLCLWGAKNIPVISRSKHVLATTLNDRGLGGDEVVGCQNLQTIAPQ